MSHRITLTHRTTYRYARPIQLSPQLVRLKPAPHTRARITAYSLKVEPAGHFLNWQQDAHGNSIARLVYPDKVSELTIAVDLTGELEAHNPFDFFLEPYAERVPFTYAAPLARDLAPYLTRTEVSPRLAALIEQLDRRETSTVQFLIDVNRAVHRCVDYVVRLEPGYYSPEETLERGKGSCRDSAWLLVEVMRQLGIAARFVSGYLVQLVPDERAPADTAAPVRDFADLHAWCECYVPGAGWLGLDPTSGLLAAEGHIPLACTSSPETAAPVEGAREPVETDFDFALHVERSAERPRPKRPFAEPQWEAIVSLGARVDRDLHAHDVRLTMGGEPTFVSVANRDAPEWNTDALGGDKQPIAERLLQRLYPEWSPGGLIHHGQGKWYPGESLPRWSVASYFRRDGVPLWTDLSWLAASDSSQGHDAAAAKRFAVALSQRLGVDGSNILPAYEDVWYHLWRERRLPVDVDPLAADLSNAAERDLLARVFHAGLNTVVGYVLPLGHDEGWRSGRWPLRDETCFLLPGDSPMGYRLPLDSLPRETANDPPAPPAQDPFAPRGPLPRRGDLPLTDRAELHAPRAEQTLTAGVVRTALCVEPRSGTLRVFLPPLATLEAFLELVAAVEATARETRMRVQVEGYPPPADPRLEVFKVTPDPGVIEVNVPKVESFAELVAQNHALFAAARAEGLAPDKFELDGIHVGAGGGHHIALGGATAEASPFLRRPDLLASMVAYWSNHPALSYFFTGRFVGPTSQAPRVDEARMDSMYEIELALRQAHQEPNALPWVVDRLFRHLLVDVTGNTHRAEVCIDKLYSPDGPSGRLGLVELRAFEMAPHYQMSSLGQLLVRALVAWLWREPYDVPPARFGTVLHDRYMLPYFLERDLLDVLGDLQRCGYDFKPEWFDAQRDFRFPVHGRVEHAGTTLELRAALEPWPTLGEEATGSGQSRYVDSSLERIQVVLTGITPGRHAVACNGCLLPLHPTGRAGEAIAAVRYRAWQPPSSLQPRIAVHSPLTFDLYDCWTERALFGCTYHVVHPGGRVHVDRPINAMAAESRRVARFETFGHTPGRYELRRVVPSPEYPLTLDLRRATVESGDKVTLRQLAGSS